MRNRQVTFIAEKPQKGMALAIAGLNHVWRVEANSVLSFQKCLS